MKPQETPQKPRTEPSARERLEQLLQLIRDWQPRKDHATAANGTGASNRGNFMFNDKAHITEHSIKDRLEPLINSIRGEPIPSKYAATVAIRIEPKNPTPFTVQDARKLLFSGCHWNFTASGRELEKKEKATRRRRVKTSKKWDDLKTYPWSVGPDYAAAPVGLETVSEDPRSSAHGERSSSSAAGSSNTRSGRTNISRTPKIYEGFAMGSIPPKQAYHPLLPPPLTSSTGYRPVESESEGK